MVPAFFLSISLPPHCRRCQRKFDTPRPWGGEKAAREFPRRPFVYEQLKLGIVHIHQLDVEVQLFTGQLVIGIEGDVLVILGGDLHGDGLTHAGLQHHLLTHIQLLGAGQLLQLQGENGAGIGIAVGLIGHQVDIHLVTNLHIGHGGIKAGDHHASAADELQGLAPLVGGIKLGTVVQGAAVVGLAGAAHVVLVGDFIHEGLQGVAEAGGAGGEGGAVLLHQRGEGSDAGLRARGAVVEERGVAECLPEALAVFAAVLDGEVGGGVADAAGGGVEHAQQVQVRVRVVHHLQVADEVLHLLAVEEAACSDHAVGDVLLAHGGFELSALDVGAEEDGHVLPLEVFAAVELLHLVCDEGGGIIQEPIAGISGKYAMLGVFEKGAANLYFKARSKGGHASAPPKNTPLARLAAFINEVETTPVFRTEISPEVSAMFERLSKYAPFGYRLLFDNLWLFRPLMKMVLPLVSAQAGAMLKTTIAFTVASGADACNVIPQEATVGANMRFIPHQGMEESLAIIRAIAEKHDIEMEVIRANDYTSPADIEGEQFKLVESTVKETFPGLAVCPYVVTAATDARFLQEICDSCVRFAPVVYGPEQMKGMHGLNENLEYSCLPGAVDFYKNLIRKQEERG